MARSVDYQKDGVVWQLAWRSGQGKGSHDDMQARGIPNGPSGLWRRFASFGRNVSQRNCRFCHRK